MRRLLLALALLVAAIGTAAADDFAGRYAAAGVTPQGAKYKADVQIEQLGSLHVVLWKLEGGAAYKGIGIRQGDKLGVGYGTADTKFGIAVYKVSGGRLEGLWADSRDLKSELGKETLEGSPDLNGTYKIVLGQNRDGMTNYSGSIDIKRNGNTFLFYWPTKTPSLASACWSTTCWSSPMATTRPSCRVWSATRPPARTRWMGSGLCST